MVAATPRSRSKSGCLTCRGCKVKCDELRPVCKRCVRLNLACEYMPDGAAVRIHDRRIGAGPIKKRQYTGWQPPRLAAAPPAALPTPASLPSPCIQTEQMGQMEAAPFGFPSLSSSNLFACDPMPITSAAFASFPTQEDFMFLSAPQDDFLAVASSASPIDAFLSANFIFSGDMNMFADVESDDSTTVAPTLSTPTMSISTLASQSPALLPLSLRLGTTAIVLSAFNSRARLTEQDYDALYLFHNHVGFSVGSKSPMWSTHAILIKLAVHHSAILHFLLAASYTERHWRRGQPETDEYLSSDNYDEAARAHYLAGEAALAEMTAKAKLGGDNSLYHVVVVACFWLEYLIHRRRDGRARNLLRGRERSNEITVYRRWATTDDFSRAMGDHVQAYSLRKSLMGYTEQDTHDRDSRDSTPEDDFEINYTQNQLQQVPAKLPPQMYRSFLSRLLSWLYWYDCTTAFFGQGGQLAKQFQLRYNSNAGQTLLHVPLYKSKYKSHVDSFYETARTTLFDFWQNNYTPAEVADDKNNWPALQLINETWVVVHALNLLEDATPNDRLDKLDLIVRNTRELRVRHQIVFWLSQQSEEGHCNGSTDNNKTAPECTRSRQLAMADWAVCHQLALELHVIRAGGPSSSSVSLSASQIAAQIIQFAERAIRTVGPVELDRFQWSLFWAGTATEDAVYRSFVMKHLINANFRAALGVVHARVDRATMSLAELRAICRSVALDY